MSVYAMAQLSKATIPRDIGGPSGRRIQLQVGGAVSWALRVAAFVTTRIKSGDWNR
ncbi:hypothetical protein BDZ97DRAFT_1797849 [Flammula alnicola]|nr:hypothetical protein BDZ97DRAFT_1797849 [Flammula alnicola]